MDQNKGIPFTEFRKGQEGSVAWQWIGNRRWNYPSRLQQLFLAAIMDDSLMPSQAEEVVGKGLIK